MKIILLLSLVIVVAFGELLFVAMTTWSEHPAPCMGCPPIPVSEDYIESLLVDWVILLFANLLFSISFAYIAKEIFPAAKVKKWLLYIPIFLILTGYVSYIILVWYFGW